MIREVFEGNGGTKRVDCGCVCIMGCRNEHLLSMTQYIGAARLSHGN